MILLDTQPFPHIMEGSRSNSSHPFERSERSLVGPEESDKAVPFSVAFYLQRESAGEG